jgi:aspartate-semialdehyde dehydrogenase
MKLGLIGWRGMVGSVLVERMLESNDFDHCTPYLFTTSQVGQSSPFEWAANTTLLDAYDLDELSKMDALIVTQGSEYTQAVYDKLYAKGWQGYWIDAASHLRMAEHARIVLDPINGEQIKASIKAGIKTYVGGNCTVSLMLLAIDGLVKRGLVEWIVAYDLSGSQWCWCSKNDRTD